MSLDLLIVHPSARSQVYSGLGDALVAKEPPLWARMIAGYVRDRSFSVRILDAEADGLTPEQVAWYVRAERPRLVAIVAFGHQPSGASQQMHGASLTASAIKSEDPYQIIVMIGGHVAALPEETLRKEDIDFACNGEGPVTVVALLSDGLPEKIPGLVWWDGDDVRINPRAAFPEMRYLHGNVWDLLDLSKTASHNWQRLGELNKRTPYASIATTLNCPYRCTFCCISAPFGDNRYRKRDPKEVVSEIVMLYDKYGVETFKISDEMYLLGEAHFSAISQGIIDAGIGDRLNFWSYGRCDSVKPKTLDLLRRSGMRWIALGIESGSKHVRDGADKVFTNEDIFNVVRSIEGAGISVISNWIFGLPDDDMESMQNTLDLSLELCTDFANQYVAQAYPGSELYRQAVKSGARLPDNYLGFSQHAYETHPLDTEHVRAEEVLRFRDAAFQTYFRNPRYLSMIREKFGSATVAHIEAMTAKTIRRKLLETA